MNENNLNAEILAKKINKKYGVLLYSGTLAIEAALRSLNIKENDLVIVSSTVCYSVIKSIIRVGAIPVIITPKNGFVLSVDDILPIIEKKNIKCIILVHQYGLVQEIKEIKECTNLPIIEDIAQAWDVKVNEESTGKYSDIVITSFGKTKPLSLGYGGAIFSNKNYNKYFDFYDNSSRESKYDILSYTLNIEKKQILKILKKSKIIIKHQRKIANTLNNIFKDNEDIIYFKDKQGNHSIFHRYPIIVKDDITYNSLINFMEKNNILYQLPHYKEIFEIPLVVNSKSLIYNNNYKKEKIILIRTRQNKLKNIKKLKRFKNGKNTVRNT